MNANTPNGKLARRKKLLAQVAFVLMVLTAAFLAYKSLSGLLHHQP